MKNTIALITAWALSAGLLAAPPQSAGLTAAEQKEGWKVLFDGKTTTGWTPRGVPAGAARGTAPATPARPAAKWVVENGELVPVKGSGAGHLVTNQSYGDFSLRLEFWSDAEANSGVFVRSPESGAINANVAYEVNIFDAHDLWPTGSINNVQKTSRTPKTVGKWNTYEITAQGDHVVIVLNGEKTVDVTASRAPRGVIALQVPAMGVARFKNVRIKAL